MSLNIILTKKESTFYGIFKNTIFETKRSIPLETCLVNISNNDFESRPSRSNDSGH